MKKKLTKTVCTLFYWLYKYGIKSWSFNTGRCCYFTFFSNINDSETIFRPPGFNISHRIPTFDFKILLKKRSSLLTINVVVGRCKHIGMRLEYWDLQEYWDWFHAWLPLNQWRRWVNYLWFEVYQLTTQFQKFACSLLWLYTQNDYRLIIFSSFSN